MGLGLSIPHGSNCSMIRIALAEMSLRFNSLSIFNLGMKSSGALFAFIISSILMAKSLSNSGFIVKPAAAEWPPNFTSKSEHSVKQLWMLIFPTDLALPVIHSLSCVRIIVGAYFFSWILVATMPTNPFSQ